LFSGSESSGNLKVLAENLGLQGEKKNHRVLAKKRMRQARLAANG